MIPMPDGAQAPGSWPWGRFEIEILIMPLPLDTVNIRLYYNGEVLVPDTLFAGFGQ